MAALPLRDLPRLRDRVAVEGHEGVYIVVAINSARAQVDLAGASQVGYLFDVPLCDLQPLQALARAA